MFLGKELNFSIMFKSSRRSTAYYRGTEGAVHRHRHVTSKVLYPRVSAKLGSRLEFQHYLANNVSIPNKVETEA